VVIYQGTNDGVEPAEFEGVYADLLACVRSTYPAATISAVCPHTTAIYAAAIGNAVAAQHDRGISFLDFSAGVIDAADTCDGCHLNPGGAVACRLATDIAERLRG
jgi:hypothetical protein